MMSRCRYRTMNRLLQSTETVGQGERCSIRRGQRQPDQEAEDTTISILIQGHLPLSTTVEGKGRESAGHKQLSAIRCSKMGVGCAVPVFV